MDYEKIASEVLAKVKQTIAAELNELQLNSDDKEIIVTLVLIGGGIDFVASLADVAPEKIPQLSEEIYKEIKVRLSRYKSLRN